MNKKWLQKRYLCLVSLVISICLLFVLQVMIIHSQNDSFEIAKKHIRIYVDTMANTTNELISNMGISDETIEARVQMLLVLTQTLDKEENVIGVLADSDLNVLTTRYSNYEEQTNSFILFNDPALIKKIHENAMGEYQINNDDQIIYIYYRWIPSNEANTKYVMISGFYRADITPEQTTMKIFAIIVAIFNFLNVFFTLYMYALCKKNLNAVAMNLQKKF
ncbi:hypothetical protein AGMMS50284_0790 [Clostridia bacterium]|nr:hypothetical protein AGMMS50284_0790 [Clostridia bacterium]